VHQAQCSVVEAASSAAVCSRISPEVVSSHFIPLLVQIGAKEPSADCRRAECDSEGMSAATSTERAVSHTQKERVDLVFTMQKSYHFRLWPQRFAVQGLFKLAVTRERPRLIVFALQL